jgi:3-oxoacyl-[acyl-carrier protein] reductase
VGELAGKVAVITGAARKQGLGFAIAKRLIAESASVVLSDKKSNEEHLKESVTLLRERGGKVIPAFCNVTDEVEVNALIDTAVKEFGGVHILVNNAGIIRDNIIMRMNIDNWDNVLSTNLQGAFLCTRAALRPMIKQRWGRIINMSSVAGVLGNVGQANYSSAKAGMIGLTKTVAREVASRNITSNAVAPGYIATHINESMPQAAKDAILGTIPMGRYGESDEVAAVVAFLASEDAHYVTGQVIDVDGGMTLASSCPF